ncbi:DUF6884 domain-containing protein [Streptomyces sp. NPDC085460]|uniref:DUF6884 domain-containing protein n=1 Tax=Streptomyces sp. NPDC085460 TaxID=3365723 RepID=UPI0037D8925C
MNRPLENEGFGAARAERRDRRLAGYLTASPLDLRLGYRAETRLEFAEGGGKGKVRAQAAREFAAAFGVETREVCVIKRGTYTGEERITWLPRVLTVHGDAESVARYVAALPRIIDYTETLATQAARSYGHWSRRAIAEPHIENLDAAGRRAAARAFRAAAFLAAARVLARPEDTDEVTVVDQALAPWEQVDAIAGGIAVYGWVDITEAYDPAEATRLLDDARRSGLHTQHHDEARALAIRQAERAQALRDALDTEPGAIAEDAATTGPVVVIPCSGSKLPHRAEAGRIYTGPLHTHARRTADALTATGGTVLILSALHGLLTLSQEIEPYDHTWNDPGSVTEDELRAQAGALGISDAADVVLLTPGKYTQRGLAVWPDARTPLAHLGIGSQRGRLTTLRKYPEQYAAAA